MHPNDRNLAMRDPAMAMLVGAVGGSDFGAEFGEDYGVEFGADAQPTPDNMLQAWNEKQATRKREMLLSPNMGSDVKIQRYTFGVSANVTLSTANASLTASGNPETVIRPQRVTTNAPAPAFVRLASIKVANVGVIVGGEIDAYDLAATADNAALDVPTLSPANQVKVTGAYSGLLPLGGYVTATTFVFITSFKGPANMVA